MRDTRTVSRILVRSLRPSEGGSDLRNPGITGKLQILQHVEIPSVVEGELNLSKKDSPLYVGMIPHALRLEGKKMKKERKMKRVKWEKKLENKRKIVLEKLKMDYFWLCPPEYMDKQ